MNTERLVEDRIRSRLLETVPAELPDRVFDATFERTRSMPQTPGVRPWATSSMNPFARMVAAVIAVAVVVGGSLYLLGPNGRIGGTPASPSPVASPSATPAGSTVAVPVPTDWTAVTSDRFAYSIDRPTDWVATVATDDWPANTFPTPFGSSVDRYGATADAETFVFVSSVALESGEVAAEKFAELDSDNALSCNSPTRQTITLDGTDARREESVCFGRDHVIEVAVAHGGRFYLIDYLAPRALTDGDRATFDRFLSSFRFGA